jgi:hypothetical protein
MELTLVNHGAGWCWVVWGYERPNGFGNGVGLSKASVSARSLVACEVQGESAKNLASMSPFIEGWTGKHNMTGRFQHRPQQSSFDPRTSLTKRASQPWHDPRLRCRNALHCVVTGQKYRLTRPSSYEFFVPARGNWKHPPCCWPSSDSWCQRCLVLAAGLIKSSQPAAVLTCSTCISR